MTRKIMILGTIAAFGLAAAIVGAGDTLACDKATKSASAANSSGCTKDTQQASASAASATTASTTPSCCTKGAKATTAGNVHKSMIKSAMVAPGASPVLNTAAFAAGASGSTMAAGSGSCCDSKSAGATASSTKACDEAKAIRAGTAGKSCDASAVKTAGAGSCEKTTTTTAAVDVVPYRQDKRLVLTGSYECGHCEVGATADCTPMFKTTDGKVYPLWNSNQVASLRQDEDKNVEIATVVKQVGGVKYLDVKSHKNL